MQIIFPFSLIFSVTISVRRNVPKRLTSISFLKTSKPMGGEGVSSTATPALFNSTSILLVPKFFLNCSKLAESEISSLYVTRLDCVSGVLPDVEVPITDQPLSKNNFAVARPIPLLIPVINIVFIKFIIHILTLVIIPLEYMKYFLISIILIIGAVFGYMNLFPKSNPTNEDNTHVTVPKIKGEMSIQAWIYPGEPTCDVKDIIRKESISVLKAEFFKIDENGDLLLLTEENDGCNAYSPEFIIVLKENSKEQYATVSGHALEMGKMFADSKKSDSAINTLIEFTETNQITGIELDFEDYSAWSKTDYQLYKNFVTKLGTKLHALEKKLAIDGPPISNKEEQGYYLWKYSDFDQLPVDYLVVMAYDYQNDFGAGTPIAPNSWVKNIIELTKKEIQDSNRIVIGIPAYGYMAEEGSTVVKIKTKKEMEKFKGFNTAQRNSDSFELQWKQDGTVYVFMDTIGLSQKLDLITELGINSVSVWHLGNNDFF
jgi:spore germination protein YaaH